MPGFIPDAELRFRTIFEGAGVPILVLNANGSIVECNSATVELLGYSAEQLATMSIRDLTYTDDQWESSALLDELASGRRKHYQLQNRYLRCDHQVIWAMLTVSIVPTAKVGGTRHAIAVLENITERKRAEQALQASREHLEASIQAS